MPVVTLRQPPGPARTDGAFGEARELILMGAHGGAGVTTLAALLGNACDLGAIRPNHHGLVPLRAAGRPVVLVTRNTVRASAQAAAAIGAIRTLSTPIAVLVVVSDGLPEPAEARYRFRLLADDVGAVIRVPFVAAFRIADDPARVDLPRKARRVIACIRPVAELSSTSPPQMRAP